MEKIDIKLSAKILKSYTGTIASVDQKIIADHMKHDPDLGVMESILVSTNMNRNDDVFLRDEVWAAKATPVHKPVNWNHDNTRIIGHMFESIAVDKTGKEINSDDIPDFDFDILAKSFIYKGALPDDASKLLDGFSEGEHFVSMECWFTDYDYLVGHKVVARNENTAFLDECLKVKGGSGKYGDERVGRVLRNIIFGGVGVVKNPANPDSVIKSVADKESDNLKVLVTEELDEVIASNVVSEILCGGEKSDDSDLDIELACASRMEESSKMANENTEAENKALKDTIEELKAQVEGFKNSEMTKKVESLEAKLEEVNTENVKLQEEVDAKSLEITSATEDLAKIDEIKKELEETKSALDDIRKNETLAKRIDELKASYEISDDFNDKYSETIKDMEDDAFAQFKEMVGGLVPAKVEKDEGAEDNTEADTEDEVEEEVVDDASKAALDAVDEPSEAELVSDVENDKDSKSLATVAAEIMHVSLEDDE